MALPLSGAISMSQIKSELRSTSNSLRTYSSVVGETAPDSMSEFYGYSGCNEFSITSLEPNFGITYIYRECENNTQIQVDDFFGTTTVCSTIVPITVGQADVQLIGEC
jgi:hypothetical protein